ncbi:MAG: phytase [Deferribacteres bacterium]|nr:phytase [candidate division KSB1 bacterium]MCB9512138.1 phytase [Deferribacteres bacterium]
MQYSKRLFFTIIGLAWAVSVAAQPVVKQSLVLTNDQVEDQDDICLWIHPNDPTQSTIIASDKVAGKIFVYDLQGQTLQTLSDNYKPGNIDVRYGFPIGGELIDIVAFNNRDGNTLVVYKVDRNTRLLERIDTREIKTTNNYGLCLYLSPKTGLYNAFITAKNGHIQQFELFENNGAVDAKLVREFNLSSQTEGCVCDDETGQAYFGEEDEGIWKIGAEKEDGESPTMIAKVGDASGLADDVEGLTLYYAANGTGYLIASSQGENRYTVFERQPPHNPVGEFQIDGVTSTDGIDVANVPLGSEFPQGIFMYHNGESSPYPAGAASWKDIASSISGGLLIDTNYWNPRFSKSTAVETPDELAPQDFSLNQNYPNPFNPETTITFELNRPANVKLSIVNLTGATIRTLIDGQLNAGQHRANWDGLSDAGKQAAAGTYLYRIESDNRIATRKLTLLK